MLEENNRAGFARGGLAAMPAFVDAPELYRPAPAPDDPLTRADARRDEDFVLRVAAETTAFAGRLVDEQPTDIAEGYSEGLLARFGDASATLLQEAPSPAAENAARDAIGRAQGRFVGEVVAQEAAARTVRHQQALIGGLAQFNAAAERAPHDVDALHAEGAAAIASAENWLGRAAAEKLGRQWTEEIYRSSLQSLIATDPQDALKRLAEGHYGQQLTSTQIAQLRDEAEDRSRVISRDQAQMDSQKMRNAEMTRESNRARFHAKFMNALRKGEARYIDVYDAAREGFIAPADRVHYEASLGKANLERQTKVDRALRVAGFIDGNHAVPPSADEAQAHFESIMRPIIDAAPAEERGRLYADYVESLGRHRPSEHPANVETGLTPPVGEAVDPQAIYKMLNYDASRGEVAQAFRHPMNGAVALDATVRANNYTERLFSGLPTHNNAADAYRHAYWNFLLTRQLLETGQDGPEIAQKFTDAHEVEHFKETLFGWLPESTTGVRSWPEDERLMDLFNNEIGRRLAVLPENAGRSAEDVVWQALREGKLQTQPMKIKSRE